MKSLQKLRLINWHYFANTTTDIKNITFLTGPNGTGKSTIIDALQILILGSTAQHNFNKAANEKGKAGRSLISYLRGQTGVKDDGSVINLRSGTFTSYIAIELFDDVENRTFTVGACFDVTSTDYDKHYFYLDSPFPSNGFSNSDIETDKSKVRPMQYKELANFAKENYKPNHFKFFDTESDYQIFVKDILGNLPDKYFTLFKKAVSFSPISNISSFITEYICDADLKVDITPMQKNVEQYKLLESQARTLKNKVDALQKIHETFAELQVNNKKIDTFNYISARISYEESQKKIDTLNERLAKDNNRLTAIGDEIGRIDAQLADLNSDLNSYNAKKLQSNNYSLTEKLSTKKNSIMTQISAIQIQINNVVTTLSSYCKSYQVLCDEFVSYYSDFDASKLGDSVKDSFEELVELCEDIRNEARSILEGINSNELDFTAVRNFRNDMECLRNKVISLESLLNKEYYEVSNQLQSLQSDLSAVNQGRKPFDKLAPVYMNIKEALETSLKARHSDAYVKIYCDLVDVNDPEWTMALEAVLFNQKFNFFVNPRYYEEANRLLKELSDTYHYYHISLVDTERLLNSNIIANEDSIANLIDTDNEGARAYTDYLLGRIKKCYTFDEARNSGSGLLSDCTGYRGYATWYLNKNNAHIFFLGTKVSSNAKAVSSADYHATSQKHSLIAEALNKLKTLLDLKVMSENECEAYASDVKRGEEVANLQNQIDSVDSEMKMVVTGDMSLVDNKITEIQTTIKELNARNSELLTERGQLLANINRIQNEDLPQANLNLQQNRTALEQFDEDIVNNEYEPFFNKILEEKGATYAQIRQEAFQESIRTNNRLNHDRTVLSRLRNDYVSTYHLNYDTQNEKSNEEFDKELETISQVLLPDYEEKISKAHEDSIREFKDDFIYKLRRAIETVYAQIDELNTALHDSQFGRDSYQFKVSPNKDYIEYYNMIMDPLLLQAGDAENLFMEKYKATMDDLFGLISSSTTASGEQREQVLRNIQTFTTYTTYIIFDLLVTRGLGDNKETISLGKSFTSQSGGETQTPFYIAILASFAQLCRVNNAADSNTLRLVIFDEAFSKMDATRIRNATNLLRQFGLQCILSTPSEKLRDLVSFVDLILITNHVDKTKRSYLDVYQEKSKRENLAIESAKTAVETKDETADSPSE